MRPHEDLAPVDLRIGTARSVAVELLLHLKQALGDGLHWLACRDEACVGQCSSEGWLTCDASGCGHSTASDERLVHLMRLDSPEHAYWEQLAMCPEHAAAALARGVLEWGALGPGPLNRVRALSIDED